MNGVMIASHKHRCMRCDEEFACQTPGICQAKYDVLPTIVTPGPTLTEHCPDQPDWNWIRGRIKRERVRIRGELVLLARLAAESPQFDNPLHVLKAKELRDRILAEAQR